ncbi:MAG: hypothetical protein JHC93_05525 [Parachlamydiales bacterium]|nr:hypothetical protein [Parachlamydiales bacterium]
MSSPVSSPSTSPKLIHSDNEVYVSPTTSTRTSRSNSDSAHSMASEEAVEQQNMQNLINLGSTAVLVDHQETHEEFVGVPKTSENMAVTKEGSIQVETTIVQPSVEAHTTEKTYEVSPKGTKRLIDAKQSNATEVGQPVVTQKIVDSTNAEALATKTQVQGKVDVKTTVDTYAYPPTGTGVVQKETTINPLTPGTTFEHTSSTATSGKKVKKLDVASESFSKATGRKHISGRRHHRHEKDSLTNTVEDLRTAETVIVTETTNPQLVEVKQTTIEKMSAKLKKHTHAVERTEHAAKITGGIVGLFGIVAGTISAILYRKEVKHGFHTFGSKVKTNWHHMIDRLRHFFKRH